MVGVLPLVVLIPPDLAVPEVEVGLESELTLEGFQTVVRHPLRKALVEPEVVSLHGHVVAEPMVGQLVGDHQRDDVKVVLGRILRQHVLLAEGNDARILHGKRSELSYEDLVVLAERIGQSEPILEKVHAGNSGIEDEFGVIP
jgi:hypothetical protein